MSMVDGLIALGVVFLVGLLLVFFVGAVAWAIVLLIRRTLRRGS